MKKVVVGIIKKEGGVLIVQRKNKEKSKDGSVLSWVFPGGAVENETKREAVKREVLEETGCKIKVEQLISSRHHPQFPVKIFYYSCRLVEEEAEPDTKEIEQIKWVKPEELTSYFTTDLDDGVAKYFDIIN